MVAGDIAVTRSKIGVLEDLFLNNQKGKKKGLEVHLTYRIGCSPCRHLCGCLHMCMIFYKSVFVNGPLDSLMFSSTVMP